MCRPYAVHFTAGKACIDRISPLTLRGQGSMIVVCLEQRWEGCRPDLSRK